jgi:hypothetical protein
MPKTDAVLTRLRSSSDAAARSTTGKRREVAAPALAAPVSAANPPAQLRDRLLTELAEMLSADAMAGWAHRCPPVKNTLCATDAKMLEAYSEEKLAAIRAGGSEDEAKPTDSSVEAIPNKAMSQNRRGIKVTPLFEWRTTTLAVKNIVICRPFACAIRSGCLR